MTPFTLVLHGNDATGKTSLCRALNSLGHFCLTRGDATPEQAQSVDLSVIDSLTLQIPSDDRPPLKQSRVHAGQEHRIVRIILDADVSSLLVRIAKRTQPADKWESEKALFYFRARFRELAAFYGIPIVRTDDGKTIDETVKEIVAYAENHHLLDALEELSLRKLTPERIKELAARDGVVEGVDYQERLHSIITKECKSPASLFTADDVLSQCAKDPKLVYALVNSYDNRFPTASPTGLSLRLVVEGESKQVFRVSSPISSVSAYFSALFFIILKPTIYSHSRQSTAEIPQLSSIRAQGSRLFLEMLHRAGVDHTYLSLNAHGVLCARDTQTTPIETVYKAYCEGTDKHSFYHYRNSSEGTIQETGEYAIGPYVRFDWRNPNHTFKGVDVSKHPFYHLMESSIGKETFYARFLGGGQYSAVPMGDKCVPESLAHPVQDVENSRCTTLQTYLTIRWYLNQLGLEVQDGCIMVDREGKVAWSEINQDCMRIKRIDAGNAEAFDKDVWRAGGSSAKDKIQTKWIQLNALLSDYLTSRPFHTNEMLSPYEPYGMIAHRVLLDTRFSSMPESYRRLYGKLATHCRLLPSSTRKPKTCFSIGITGTSKYGEKSDAFILSHLGIRVVRTSRPSRSLKYDYEIVDPLKSELYFGTGRTIRFVPMKPKDMAAGLARGQLDYAVTYSSVMDNHEMCQVSKTPLLLASVQDPDISLALICRKGSAKSIDPISQWSPSNRARLVVEHPTTVYEYLSALGVPESHYELDRVLGSSESYLVNDEEGRYVLCDAVVSSGKTLDDNGLEVWKVMKDKGECTVGLYKLC